jgi:CubicO group peptidase (beta-lactamase class C family)
MRTTGFVSSDRLRFAAPYSNAEPEPERMTDNIEVPLPDRGGAAVRFAPSRVFDSHAFPSGGAGMYGCADDILRALEAMRIADGFLPSTLFAAMHTNHVGQHADTRGPGWGFGYGGAILLDPDLAGTPQSPGTLQWGAVYGHSWFIDSARGLTLLLLTNTSYEGMNGRLALQVRDTVYGR